MRAGLARGQSHSAERSAAAARAEHGPCELRSTLHCVARRPRSEADRHGAGMIASLAPRGRRQRRASVGFCIAAPRPALGATQGLQPRAPPSGSALPRRGQGAARRARGARRAALHPVCRRRDGRPMQRSLYSTLRHLAGRGGQWPPLGRVCPLSPALTRRPAAPASAHTRPRAVPNAYIPTKWRAAVKRTVEARHGRSSPTVAGCTVAAWRGYGGVAA